MKKQLKKWRTSVLVLTGVLVLAGVLRLVRLTSIPIFADEAIYIRWSQIMSSEPSLRFLPLSDGKQPLFMWVLMFIVRRLGDPFTAGRVISVVTGLGTIFGVFTLSYVLFRKRNAALLASALWALSPFALFYDRVALVDSMLTMFGVWALTLGVISVKTRRIDAAMASGIALGFAGLTKSPALFVGLSLPAALAIPNWPIGRKKQIERLVMYLGLLGIVGGIALGMYNILRLGPNFHLLSDRTGDYIFPVERVITHPGDPLIGNLRSVANWIWLMGPAPVYGLVILGLYVAVKRKFREVIFLLFWFLMPLLAHSLYAKALTTRYTLFFLPPLYIIAGLAILIKNRSIRGVFIFLVIIFMAWSAIFSYLLFVKPESVPLPRRVRSGFLEEWTAGTGIREAAYFIREEKARDPERRIVVGTEGYFGTLPDGLQIYMDGVEGVEVIGVGLGIGDIPEPLINAKNAGDRVYLLANSSRLKIKNFEEAGLKVVKAYEKALKPQGVAETLYLLEVVWVSE